MQVFTAGTLTLSCRVAKVSLIGHNIAVLLPLFILKILCFMLDFSRTVKKL
jgi:hypothetical protein